MVEGLKTGRTHHLLSDLEFGFFILAEFDRAVLDICEQFALVPWGLTLAIAKTLIIKHPTYPTTNIPTVMTTDLVLKVSRPEHKGLEAISVKPAKDVGLIDEEEAEGGLAMDAPSDKEIVNTLKKLLIEKTFWTIKKIPWSLKTERDLPLNKVKNLIMLRNCLVSREMDYLNSHLIKFPQLFLQVWEPTISLNALLDATGRILNLDREECFVLFGRSVWLHLLEIDLDAEELWHQLPVRLNENAAVVGI